jgi:hypothetical protein
VSPSTRDHRPQGREPLGRRPRNHARHPHGKVLTTTDPVTGEQVDKVLDLDPPAAPAQPPTVLLLVRP